MAATRNTAAVHLRRVSQGVPQDPQQVLIAAFTAIDYSDCIKNLPRWQVDPQAYINDLDQVGSHLFMLVSDPSTRLPCQILDTLSPELDIYKQCLRALVKVCGIYGLLPTSYIVPPGLTVVKKRPFASSIHAGVWKARNMDNRYFAVKHIYVYEVDDLMDLTGVLRICYSVPVRISHRRIVPRNTARRSSSPGG